jgi:hypothetical protein
LQRLANHHTTREKSTMAKFSTTELKKQLSSKTKDELIKDIVNLCQKYPQTKEYYMAQQGDVRELLAKYKDIIEKEFIEGKTRGNPKARFSIARKALNDFKKLTKEPVLIIDLMMTYAASISWFSSEYGPDEERYYTIPENMFASALEMIQKHHLEDQFRDQALAIIKNACDAWGHQDTLIERYEDVYGEYMK